MVSASEKKKKRRPPIYESKQQAAAVTESRSSASRSLAEFVALNGVTNGNGGSCKIFIDSSSARTSEHLNCAQNLAKAFPVNTCCSCNNNRDMHQVKVLTVAGRLYHRSLIRLFKYWLMSRFVCIAYNIHDVLRDLQENG